MGRGALLVLEGCDKAGKSTQARRLAERLNNIGVPAEARGFPDRSTSIGSVINDYLKNSQHLPSETVHLLFSANRWECSDEMKKTLEAGITLVVDRYAGSGAAYTSAVTGRSLDWCKAADRGLPAPDFVGLLLIEEENMTSRAGWADERFEHLDIQRKVSDNFLKLKDDTWKVIEANKSVNDIHQILIEKALEIIEKVKNTPINELYKDE